MLPLRLFAHRLLRSSLQRLQHDKIWKWAKGSDYFLFWTVTVPTEVEEAEEGCALTCCWTGTGQSSPGCSTAVGEVPRHCHHWWRTDCGWPSHWPGSQRQCPRKTCKKAQDARCRSAQLAFVFSIQLYFDWCLSPFNSKNSFNGTVSMALWGAGFSYVDKPGFQTIRKLQLNT